MAVDIDLTEHLFFPPDEDDNLAPRLGAAREIVGQFPNVGDDLVPVIGNRRSAHPAADRNPRVIGFLPHISVEHQRVPFQPIDSGPVVIRKSGEELHRLSSKRKPLGPACREAGDEALGLGVGNHGSRLPGRGVCQHIGVDRVFVRLQEEPLDPGEILRLVQDDTRGGVVLFFGDVRRVTGEVQTEHLEYEAYHEMALKSMREIGESAAGEFDAKVALHHRLGKLMPGETSVICAAACAHRAQAFECCRRLIDRLKEDVPIWKKEFGLDGAEWK